MTEAISALSAAGGDAYWEQMKARLLAQIEAILTEVRHGDLAPWAIIELVLDKLQLLAIDIRLGIGEFQQGVEKVFQDMSKLYQDMKNMESYRSIVGKDGKPKPEPIPASVVKDFVANLKKLKTDLASLNKFKSSSEWGQTVKDANSTYDLLAKTKSVDSNDNQTSSTIGQLANSGNITALTTTFQVWGDINSGGWDTTHPPVSPAGPKKGDPTFDIFSDWENGNNGQEGMNKT